MLRLILLFMAALALVAVAVWASERRAPALGAGAITAGAGVALLASLLVDCRLCLTGPLAVGALMSVPFFAVGWVALSVAGRGPVARSWLLPILAAASLQVFWALPLTYAATLKGECPCSGLIFNGAATGLAAIGIDRAVGPLLLVEAVVSGWLAFAAARRPPGVTAGR